MGREATCPPTTSQSCLWRPGLLPHTSPTSRREERKERRNSSLYSIGMYSTTRVLPILSLEGLEQYFCNEAAPASQTIAYIYILTISYFDFFNVKINVFECIFILQPLPVQTSVVRFPVTSILLILPKSQKGFTV